MNDIQPEDIPNPDDTEVKQIDDKMLVLSRNFDKNR
jgi:hypothetical protein